MVCIHRKPVGLLDVGSYYDGLLRLLGHGVAEGFIRQDYLALLLRRDTPAALLDAFESWQPPSFSGPWLAPAQA